MGKWREIRGEMVEFHLGDWGEGECVAFGGSDNMTRSSMDSSCSARARAELAEFVYAQNLPDSGFLCSWNPRVRPCRFCLAFFFFFYILNVF